MSLEPINAVLNTVRQLWNMCVGDFLLGLPIAIFIIYVISDVINRLRNVPK